MGGEGGASLLGLPSRYAYAPKSMNDFRPISLLPIFSKIFEKIIAEGMMSFIDKNSILTSSQLGFRTSNQRWSPRGHILKSLALASKIKSLALTSSPRKLACPRLEDSTIF